MVNGGKCIPFLIFIGMGLAIGLSAGAQPQPMEPAAPLAQLPPPPEAQPQLPPGNDLPPAPGNLPPPIAIPFQPEFVADPLAAVSPEDRRQFLERLAAHDACVLNWIHATVPLTEEQTAGIQKRLPRFETAEEDQTLRSILSSASRQLPAWFPGLFIGQRPTLNVTERRIITVEFAKSLSQEQITALLKSRDELFSARRSAYEDYMIAILDAELSLSGEQRKMLRGSEMTTWVEDPYYCAVPSTYYLPYKSVAALVTVTAKEKLSPAQQRRLNTLTAKRDGSGLSFSTRNTADAWESQLEVYLQQFQQEALLVFDLRLDCLAREGQLPEEQLNQLRFAAKRVTVLLSDDRKESLRKQLAEIEPRLRQRGGNSVVNFGAPSVSRASLFNHPHWISAWETVASDTRDRLDADRLAMNRLARDRAVLALLDEELWLRPSQREKLLPLVSSALPPVESLTSSSSDRMREAIWMAHVFSLLQPAQLQLVLDPPQLAAWQLMQKSFSPAENAPIRGVGLRLRSGGIAAVQLMNHDGSQMFVQPDLQPPAAIQPQAIEFPAPVIRGTRIQ